MSHSQVANVIVSSGEMYPLGSNINSLEWRTKQSLVAKSTDSSGECYSLKWRMSQKANVTFSSGECNSLEWEMYPLGNKMNSLEWRNEQLG